MNNLVLANFSYPQFSIELILVSGVGFLIDRLVVEMLDFPNACKGD
jgi:hypothetical protein